MFTCNICSKVFNLKKTLKAHSRILTEENNFAFKICSKTFRCRSNRCRHEQNVHKFSNNVANFKVFQNDSREETRSRYQAVYKWLTESERTEGERMSEEMVRLEQNIKTWVNKKGVKLRVITTEEFDKFINAVDIRVVSNSAVSLLGMLFISGLRCITWYTHISFTLNCAICL